MKDIERVNKSQLVTLVNFKKTNKKESDAVDILKEKHLYKNRKKYKKLDNFCAFRLETAV